MYEQMMSHNDEIKNIWQLFCDHGCGSLRFRTIYELLKSTLLNDSN